MRCIQLVLFFLLLSLCPAYAGALDSMVLLRTPGVITNSENTNCEVLENEDAVVPLSVSVDLQVGQQVAGLYGAGKIIKTEVTRIAQDCDGIFSPVDTLDFAMLRAQEPIRWTNETGWMAGVIGKEVSPDSIGDVSEIDDATAQKYLEKLRDRFPSGEHVAVDKAQRLQLPGNGMIFDFVSLVNFWPNQCKGIDEECKQLAFLVRKSDDKVILLNGLSITEIQSVSDMNSNGLFEIVAHETFGCCEGKYLALIFDGEKVIDVKMLYHWMD